ncbi:2-amino-4-hydroxy-6-hydroxymethyldihydropteridine diphosphokinase [Parvularcula sp. IMCC14364]|uniref:2-amino-4-hydroxy-6- hydroxymethyldihydropteridine diphosphokinase n=1 Tax=Parvularcula sp. IMCC14364 TaxID=3067902 RepID=UPI0027428ADD|nr:2-amino-4-hydroxy-6-hydroxymethyldihydropteridine diphosphokinase [Parvularcula sp. IMCC14364]
MIIIGLGANLQWSGRQPAENISLAIRAVARLGVPFKSSSLYESEAWPDPDDPVYVNAVIALTDTGLTPEDFLVSLQTLEITFGRQRDSKNRYASRSMDLDLLAFHDEIIGSGATEELTIPHPGLQVRSFVLMPLVEILPVWVHPVSGLTTEQMLRRIDAQGTRILGRGD